MNLHEFRALDEFQRFDALKGLVGDELRAFAGEVAGEQGVTPMLQRIFSVASAADATIKNQLKVELRRLGLAFQERQVEIQIDTVQTAQVEFSWERIKGSQFTERKPIPINEGAKDEFLKQLYQGEIVDVDITNPLSNIQAVRTQVEAICQKMTGYGCRNFESLKEKFADAAFNIVGAEQRQRDFSNARQIKQVMESILYFMQCAPEASRTELVANYKDTQFACSDGTLQNLNDIFGEMQLGIADIAAYVAWAKRKVVAEILMPMYQQNYFHEAGLISYSGNEIHDIDSLINAVADEFGLVVRTQEEDRFIKDASRYREFLLGELNRGFAQPEVLENISRLVAGKIFANLKGIIDTETSVQNQVQGFLVKLGVGDKYNYFHLVDCKAGRLKNIAQEVIREIVAAYFHEQGIQEVLDIELVYQFLKTAGSHNAQYEQVVTRENFPEEAEGDREAVKLVLFQDVELDEAQFGTQNPVLYFARKNANIFAEFKLGDYHLHELLKYISAEELKNILIPTVLLEISLFYVITPEQVGVLIEKGADAKIVNPDGNNAAKVAEIKGRNDLVGKFVELGILPINVFEGHENGVDTQCEEMITHTISKIPEWFNRHGLSKLIKCGMINALKSALETPKGRESLSLLDKDGNTALHHAARQPNPELFLEIIKTTEGRKAIVAANKLKTTPVAIVVSTHRVDLINSVLKTTEGEKLINGDGENKSFIVQAYEGKRHGNEKKGRYDIIRTLLKCNISLDPILQFADNRGMVQDAVDNDDFEAFSMFMERAELRNKVFSLCSDALEKLHSQGLLKPLLEKDWLEILQSTYSQDLCDFIEVAVKCDLFNEIVDKLDKENPVLLNKILDGVVRDATPISSELDEALSAALTRTTVKKWVVRNDPDKPMGVHVKRLVAKGAAETVEAILNDDFARRSIFSQDTWGNNFLHCGAHFDDDITYYSQDYDIFYEEDGKKIKGSHSRFYNCVKYIADNPYLKSALPRLLIMQGTYGKTALNLALEEMPKLFLILLDWSVRPENVHSLYVLDDYGRAPFYNALLRCYDISIMSKFVNADASFVNSIFDHFDNEMVNVISRILDNDVERIRGDELAKVAFGNVFEWVKDNPVLMRKFIDSVGNETGCSSLDYARRYDMPTIVDAILTFAQNTSLGLSLPSASLETQASASTALIPSEDDGVDATVSIPANITSKVGARISSELDDDNDYDDKTEEHKRRRKGRSPNRKSR